MARFLAAFVAAFGALLVLLGATRDAGDSTLSNYVAQGYQTYPERQPLQCTVKVTVSMNKQSDKSGDIKKLM